MGFKKILKTGIDVGAVAAGALGGPVGAAVGAGGAALANKFLGDKKKGGYTVPSSAPSIEDARAQDKDRMSKQYGI